MISINLPSVKRVPGDFELFHEAVEHIGFEHVSSTANGRVHYHENDVGMGITVINGPRANLMLPAGPIRGRLLNPDMSSLADEQEIEDVMDQMRNQRGNQAREGEVGRRNEFSV